MIVWTAMAEYLAWIRWFDIVVRFRAETIQEQVENFTKEFEKCSQK